MAKFKMQISADYVSLVLLLGKLGFVCGPLKAGGMSGSGRIDLWFVPVNGKSLKRVRAQIERGLVPSIGDTPRRVYMNVKVMIADGVWGVVEDSDYTRADLETPSVYGRFDLSDDVNEAEFDCA